MFSETQELEFNIAFLDQMVSKTHGQVNFWNDLKNAHAMEENFQNWANQERKPSNVITMHAWSLQLLELLEIWIQQNKLKLKELSENQKLPSDWAVLRFKRDEILAKMNDMHAVRTRSICREIKDKLLGSQHDFQGENNRWAEKRCKRVACQMASEVTESVCTIKV